MGPVLELGPCPYFDFKKVASSDQEYHPTIKIDKKRKEGRLITTLDLDVYFSKKGVLYSINKTVSIILRF